MPKVKSTVRKLGAGKQEWFDSLPWLNGLDKYFMVDRISKANWEMCIFVLIHLRKRTKTLSKKVEKSSFGKTNLKLPTLRSRRKEIPWDKSHWKPEANKKKCLV